VVEVSAFAAIDYKRPSDYSDDDYIYYGMQQVAIKKLKLYLNANNIKKPNKCSVCGITSEKLVAHHYAGYENWFHYWWICRSCNSILKHREYSRITIDDARKIVVDIRFKKPEGYWKGTHNRTYLCHVCMTKGIGYDMHFITNTPYPYKDRIVLCEHCYKDMVE